MTVVDEIFFPPLGTKYFGLHFFGTSLGTKYLGLHFLALQKKKINVNQAFTTISFGV
jgi:hypothetical protein